ncbi:MAG TPA: hypothetical protein VF133_06735 [Terriglobales bacterium]
MKVESFFGPELTKLLRDAFADGDPCPFEHAEPRRKRQPRRTITLSPEVYERLKDYAARHNQTVSEVANFKLESIPTEADKAELDALIASSKAQRQAFDDLFTVQPVRTYLN